MPTQTDQIITLLQSIDTSLRRVAAALATPMVATDRDLDGKYGNPELKFVPKAWTGSQEFKNRKYSECPPELLDLVAEALDQIATKSDEKGETTTAGKPVSTYKRLDAARARGWAKRLRNGWQPPPLFGGDPLLDSDDPDIDPFGAPEPPPPDDVPF